MGAGAENRGQNSHVFSGASHIDVRNDVQREESFSGGTPGGIISLFEKPKSKDLVRKRRGEVMSEKDDVGGTN